MMSNRNLDGESNFEKIATEFYYSLQRRDFVVKSDLKTNILWVDTVFRELRRVLKSNRQAVYLQRDMGMCKNSSVRDSNGRYLLRMDMF